MSEAIAILIYTTAAGLAIPIGGALASVERIRPRWLEQEVRHGVLAFGGGILLAAVALVLVPEGIEKAPEPGWIAVASLVAGGGLFMLVDRALARRGTPASMLIAVLLDFAPEAMALGALFTAKPALGPLLALMITLQNLPEGFNAYRELVDGGVRKGRVMGLFAALVPIGPACGFLGLWVLSDAPVATSVTMTLASGGILYLVFQDVAPQARLERHWAPPLGAVLGFALGLVGHLWIHG